MSNKIKHLAEKITAIIDIYVPKKLDNNIGRFLPLLSNQTEDQVTESKPPYINDAKKLNEFAEILLKGGEEVYNSRPVVGDADTQAQAKKFFDFERIIAFLPSLSTEQERWRYLKKIEKASEENDERAEVSLNGKMLIFRNPIGPKFSAKLYREINFYDTLRREHEKVISQNNSSEILKSENLRQEPEQEKDTNQTEDEETTSLRRMVIALMLLTFGRIDRPEDIQKERIVEFFHWVTGRPKKGLRDLLADPTKHKGVSRSITKICSDLNFVRDELGKMGLTDKVRNTISEIEFILDEMKEN